MFRYRKFLVPVFLSAFLSLSACGNGGQEVVAIGDASTSTVSETIQVELAVSETFDPCSDILSLHEGNGSPERQHWFNNLTYRDYARYWIACVHGWGETEWECLCDLWDHESSWNPLARNKSSGACGIPQAWRRVDPCGKMADHGPDYEWNGRTQIRWGTRYIDDRYGAPTETGCRGPY